MDNQWSSLQIPLDRTLRVKESADQVKSSFYFYFIIFFKCVSEKHEAEGAEKKAVRSVGSAQRLHIGRILES